MICRSTIYRSTRPYVCTYVCTYGTHHRVYTGQAPSNGHACRHSTSASSIASTSFTSALRSRATFQYHEPRCEGKRQAKQQPRYTVQWDCWDVHQFESSRTCQAANIDRTLQISIARSAIGVYRAVCHRDCCAPPHADATSCRPMRRLSIVINAGCRVKTRLPNTHIRRSGSNLGNTRAHDLMGGGRKWRLPHYARRWQPATCRFLDHWVRRRGRGWMRSR